MTRIISGKAGSLRIEVPKTGTRPTSDRVREAIFSTLEAWGFIADVHVLDLYAGSGALGLEAASRGAASATLVERHPPAAQVATRNARTVRAAFAGGAPRITVERQSVQSFLDGQLQADENQRPAWDVVLLDPPYDLAEAELTANLTSLTPLLAPDAAVMVERDLRSPEPTWPSGMRPVREKRYGDTRLWWAEPAG